MRIRLYALVMAVLVVSLGAVVHAQGPSGDVTIVTTTAWPVGAQWRHDAI